MKTDEAAPTHEARSPSPFRERVHALAAAHSTWRDGGGSRSTEQRQIPADHLIAAALAFGRAGQADIGPDIAFDIATGTPGHWQRVCEWLGGVLGRDRSAHCVRIRAFAGHYAVWAYNAMVRGHAVPPTPPEGVRQKDHETVILFACMLLDRAAEDALALAGRKWRGE